MSIKLITCLTKIVLATSGWSKRLSASNPQEPKHKKRHCWDVGHGWETRLQINIFQLPVVVQLTQARSHAELRRCKDVSVSQHVHSSHRWNQSVRNQQAEISNTAPKWLCKRETRELMIVLRDCFQNFRCHMSSLCRFANRIMWVQSQGIESKW